VARRKADGSLPGRDDDAREHDDAANGGHGDDDAADHDAADHDICASHHDDRRHRPDHDRGPRADDRYDHWSDKRRLALRGALQNRLREAAVRQVFHAEAEEQLVQPAAFVLVQRREEVVLELA